ncbi:MAG: ChbG/HpnK family deacetylase [Ruminococcaceae bacterium]|nr:ChbG/HpnK family deacetylase [Oscillospiraceae bacterium]
MIYICADDYGLCSTVSLNILKCLNEGVLNKVSAFVNFDKISSDEFGAGDNIALHLNLVEGRALSDLKGSLLTDEKGNFKNTFTGLLKLSLFNSKRLYEEAYREIRAQLHAFLKIFPKGEGIMIDSHQHTHMIPVVFKALLQAVSDEKVKVRYLRIPVESFVPYIKEPSLYFTYSPINIIKVALLNFLWLFNKRHFNKNPLPTGLFCGVFLSGRMDERVKKIIPHYIRLAKKKGDALEILFHPGYTDITGNKENVVFKSFYLSENRKKEFDTVMDLKG